MHSNHSSKFKQKTCSNSGFTQSFRAQAAIFLIATSASLSALAQTPDKEPSLVYTVRPTDNLIKFTRDMLVNPKAWPEVARFNQLKDPDVLSIGQKLNIPLRFLKSKPASGKVISAEGDVTLGSSAMQPGTTLADGAKIKTGPNSSAVIELGDGSRVKILPNSLAEVVSNRDYAMRDASKSGSTNWFSGLMRLTEGALEALASKTANRATPLKIETPTSVVGVRGTEFRVAFDDPLGKAARTEVIEGLVRADNPAQASGADLPRGTGAVVKPTEKEVKVVVLLPAPDLSAIPSEVLKPQGSWPMPTLAGATAYTVQIASDEQFDKIVRDLKVSSGSADLGSLPNGNWFARVRGIDGVGLEGFNTVKLIAVKDGEWRVVYSSMSVVDGKTVLTWDGQQTGGQPMEGSNYTATLASDAALTQSVVTVRGTDGKASLVLGDLKPGVYFIRLQNATGLRSQTYRFELSGNWAQTEFDKTSALQTIK
ncbi:MAG: FecR domain-containing protein [Polaromonas sp.]